MLRLVTIVFFQFVSSMIALNAADPASVAEARKAIDLTTFPAYKQKADAKFRIASQTYEATGSVQEIATYLTKQLEKGGWKSSGAGMVTAEYAADTFSKNGFLLSLSVMPASSPQTVIVILLNLGNVDLGKLPRLKQASEVSDTPNNLMYSWKGSAQDARAACLELLKKDGWDWFGNTTVSFFMRKNAIRLQVMVMDSPTKAGEVMIQYSAQQMSARIPIPTETTAVEYSDSTCGMMMDSALNNEDFCQSLSKAMTAEKWEATTDHPVKNDNRLDWIFRSPDGELAECEISVFEDKTRCSIKYMTADELAEESKKFNEKIKSQ